MAYSEITEAKGNDNFPDNALYEEAENLCDRLLILKQAESCVREALKNLSKTSPYENLEEAYLWYSEEEVSI